MRGKPRTRLPRAECFGRHEVLGFSMLVSILLLLMGIEGPLGSFCSFLRGHHDGAALTKPLDGKSVKGGGTEKASGRQCPKSQSQRTLLIYNQQEH